MLAVVVPDTRYHDLVGRLRGRLRVADPYWIEQPKRILSGFKLPDHLCSFQPATLTALLRRCGLRVVALQNAPIVFNADLKRNLGKLLVRWVSQTLYCLNFRRVVAGYSTLLLAQKVSA